MMHRPCWRGCGLPFLPSFQSILPIVILFVFLLFFLTPLLAPARGAEWKGRRVEKDGVIHVMNPAEPMEPPAVYELRDIWRLESETPEGDLVFGTVNEVTEDGEGNVYLLDTQLKTVHLISPEGEYVRSIGRAGEGPGELDDPTGVFIAPDSTIGIVDTKRLVFFTRAGVLAGEWKPELSGYSWYGLLQMFPSSKRYVVSLKRRRRVEQTISTECLAGLFDKTGGLLASLAKRSWDIRPGEPFLFDEEETEVLSYLSVAEDGSVYISPEFSEYSIHCFDPDGNLRMVIEREYEPVRREKEDVSELISYWRNVYRRVRQLDIRVEVFERNVTRLYARDDGWLWVETSRGWDNLPGGVADILDVFDSDGRFVRQAVLRKDINTENDMVFVLRKRVLIATAGYAAQMAAGGASSEGAEEPDEGQHIPAAILCRIVPLD